MRCLLSSFYNVIDPATDEEPSCCDVAVDKRHPACLPIEIPSNDEFYSLFRRKCLEFVRSATGLKENCKLGNFQVEIWTVTNPMYYSNKRWQTKELNMDSNNKTNYNYSQLY